jgi:hypothetical protein
MSKVQTYLSARFQISRWPYYSVNWLIYDLRNEAAKDELREEIRELRKSGVIELVGGLNGWLIQIKDETKF